MPTVNGVLKTKTLKFQGGEGVEDYSIRVDGKHPFDSLNISKGSNVLMQVAPHDVDYDDGNIDQSDSIIRFNTGAEFNEDVHIQGDMNVQGVINNKMDLSKTNTVNLLAHHHTKNYTEVDHHHVHGSGFKYKGEDDETYVVTAAHNLYEIQTNPTFYNTDHIADLPGDLAGCISSMTYGDGDTCIIGEEFNERELAAFSSTAGTFIYDITRAKKATEGMYGGYFSEKFINLCKFIPKSNSTDLNFFNQCKFNKSSQVLYEQPGDWLYDNDNYMHIIECSDAMNGNFKVHNWVDIFPDPLDNDTHANGDAFIYKRNYVRDIWLELDQADRDTNHTDIDDVTPTPEDNYNAFFRKYFTGKSVFYSCHNMQVFTELNLLFVIDSNTRNSPYNGNLWSPLVYDIDPDNTNPETNLPCSISPYFKRLLFTNMRVPQMTENEKDRFKNNTFFNEDGTMVLDDGLGINHADRPYFTTTALGRLPLSDFADINRKKAWQHDLLTCKRNDTDPTTGVVTERYIITFVKNTYMNSNGDDTLNLMFGWSFSGFGVLELFKNGDPDKFYPMPLQNFTIPDENLTDKPVVVSDVSNHNITPRQDGMYAYAGWEFSGDAYYNLGTARSSRKYANQTGFLVYDMRDLDNIRFVKAVTNFSQIQAVTENNVGVEDHNHNLATTRYKDKDFLGIADFVQGFHIFDISDEDPKYVAFGNPQRLTSENGNPFYNSVKDKSSNAWQVDASPDYNTGLFGITFGRRGTILVSGWGHPSVWDLDQAVDADELRGSTINMQPWTKYPFMKSPNYIKCLDQDSKELIDLEIVGIDRYTDVAVLREITSSTKKLTGGIDVSSTDIDEGTTVYGLSNNAGLSFNVVKGVLSNNKFCPSPTLVRTITNSTDVIKLSNEHEGVIELLHGKFERSNDSTNMAEVWSSSVCSMGIQSILSSCNVSSSSSGGPLLTLDNKCIGMITHRVTDGTESASIAMDINTVLAIADKQIANNFALPFLGVDLLQDDMYYDYYIVRGLDNVELNTYVESLTADDAPACGITHINGIRVGPRQTAITKVLVDLAPGDNVKLTVQGLNKYSSMGVDKWAKLNIPAATVTTTLTARPNVLDKFDESKDAANEYPLYTWFWEEKVGFKI